MINIFILVIIIEVFLIFIFKNIKRMFPWLINSKDLYPKFDPERFKKFKTQKYNYYLGWDNKPNTESFDLLNGNKIFFKIDRYGKRKTTSKKKSLIASFGDSYVFCRQNSDTNTWQENISRRNKFNISNYGVGNYGLDQSVLKYSKTKLDKNIKFVIQGFVPETISRIQSQWKHFLEFGNLHGFKPSYYIFNGQLKIRLNPLRPDTKIKSLNKIIKQLKDTDRFYKDKFNKHIIQFPFVFYFCKNFYFNFQILKQYLTLKISNLFYKKKLNIYEKLFATVVKKNISSAHSLYNEEYSKLLLSKIVNKFIVLSKKNRHIPILIIFPQLIDLKLVRTNIYYQKFFKSLKEKIHVIDLTPSLIKTDFNKMFVNDKYGGHLSKSGNKFISNIIEKELIKIFKNL